MWAIAPEYEYYKHVTSIYVCVFVRDGMKSTTKIWHKNEKKSLPRYFRIFLLVTTKKKKPFRSISASFESGRIARTCHKLPLTRITWNDSNIPLSSIENERKQKTPIESVTFDAWENYKFVAIKRTNES